jgi:hypothetical protein
MSSEVISQFKILGVLVIIGIHVKEFYCFEIDIIGVFVNRVHGRETEETLVVKFFISLIIDALCRCLLIAELVADIKEHALFRIPKFKFAAFETIQNTPVGTIF